MVRQAHHDRLDLPLVLSSVEGLRSSRLTGRRNRPKLASLYWICRRSDKGRGHDRIKAVIVGRVRVFGLDGDFRVLVIIKN
jgi:hypothetical protein